MPGPRRSMNRPIGVSGRSGSSSSTSGPPASSPAIRAPSESSRSTSARPRISWQKGSRSPIDRTASPTWAIRVPRRSDDGIGLALQVDRERSNLTRFRGIAAADGVGQGMSSTLAVTDVNFEAEIEQHSGLVVVDFWATWCGPCRLIAPIIDQLATEYDGKAKVAKLDVDSNIKTASRFNVRSIPTILFFKDGKLVDQVVGAVQKPALESKFKQHAA